MEKGSRKLDPNNLPGQTRPLMARMAPILVGLICLSALPTFLGLMGQAFWLLELLSHFAFQSMLGLILGVFILARMKKWRWAMFPLAALIINVVQLMPFFLAPEKVEGLKVPVTFMTANVYRNNTDHQALLDLVQLEKPDVLVLVETDGHWADGVQELLLEYPYMVSEIRMDPYGMMVLSKLPIISSSFHSPKKCFVPLGQLQIQLGFTNLTLFAVHAKPPMSDALANRRNLYLKELARQVQETDGPVLMLGDLNLTPFSPHFRQLKKESGLLNSAQGTGWQPTWPSYLPGFMKIPIDHGLHSKDLVTLDRRILDLPGSDHHPVFLTIGF